MNSLQLSAEDNQLGIMLGNELYPLVYFHPSGDVDTIQADKPDLTKLAAALYDEREQGNIASNCKAARLPDGTVIEF